MPDEKTKSIKPTEIVNKNGSVLKGRDSKGKFVAGNTEKLGKPQTTEITIAKLFNKADKATIANFSRKTKDELIHIRDNPESTAMEVIDANLLIEAMSDLKWHSLAKRIMKTPERAMINIANITNEQKNSDIYQSVFVLPLNGREADD